MNVFTWLKRRLSTRYRALWLYRRGMMRAKSRDNQAAIADYTAVLEMAHVPAQVRAMALYNRALVYHTMHDDAKAILDLRKVLEMGDVAEDVKVEARRKLVRMERESHRTDDRDATRNLQSRKGNTSSS